MRDLLVIGGASLDVLHFSGKSVHSPGGAGLYTAAAANRMGVRVSMYAPRPDPMPESLKPLSERIEWIGPVITVDELPRFEITHLGGGKTELQVSTLGVEHLLDPMGMPMELSQFQLVHITALGTAQNQLDFLKACRSKGARWISIGTARSIIHRETESVRSLFDGADVFFMNADEACALFGSAEAAVTHPGKYLFITLGNEGVLVIQGEQSTHLPALEIEELDPTGAGDSFCGATLAGLAMGEHPVMAARAALPLAAHMITAVGPTALWEEGPPPVETQDNRVVLNLNQIDRVAARISALEESENFDFTGDGYPPVGHPVTIDFFFASTLQQFGFWETAEGRYSVPLIATIDGVEAKGSDYLWLAYFRKLTQEDSDFFTPRRHAEMTREDMLELFRADDGSDPMPALDLHLAQARSYGEDMLALGHEPIQLVDAANAAEDTLGTFLGLMDHIGGYKEDPLRKKPVLLALILADRPEGFLKLRPDSPMPPIIDYHLMRSCLRTGLIDVVDSDLEERLQGRCLLEPEKEWAVRYSAYQAIEKLVEVSGKSMGFVDWFFFNSRRYCPEMTEPECFRCHVDPVCAHRKDLFQPVFRTTAY
ncbi:MAG: hypothetical protein GTO18_22055 [Anaerolineales bacterium]|nr:hypothetical protein [Anaerolineales bacterium]